MHEVIFFFAVGWMTMLLAANAVAVIRLKSTAARILALDTLTVVLSALLVVYAAAEGASYYMDVALILALLAFVGTLVAARYHGERKVF